MSAATIYCDLVSHEPVVTVYKTASSLNANEIVLDFCNLKPAISSPSKVLSLWKEVVVVVSQNNDTLWIVDVSMRKVIAQFKVNFSCLATAHYIIPRFLDTQFFANTPLVRCHGCAQGARHSMVTGFLTKKDVLLVEFSSGTNSFKPLISVPVKKGAEETLEPYIYITAQHVAILCSYSPANDTSTITSMSQSDSYGVIYLSYLGEVTNTPVRIPIPGTILHVMIEENNGTDVLTIQFRTDDGIEITEYAAQPLSNLWAPINCKKTKHYLIDRLGPGVYQYSLSDTGANIVQYTKPRLPCISLLDLSRNCTLAYRNGVLVGVDVHGIYIFIGSVFVRQEISTVAGTVDLQDLKFLNCTLTETFQVILCAETATGTHIFILRRPKGKHHYRVVTLEKHFKLSFNPKNAIWVPVQCKIFCVEQTRAYCLIMSKDTCTMLIARDNGDKETYFTIDSEQISLPFAIMNETQCPEDCSMLLQKKITVIYHQLCEIHSQFPLNIKPRRLIIEDETDIEIQKLITPITSSEVVTPVRDTTCIDLPNTSLQNSLEKSTSIIANANMYPRSTSQTHIVSNSSTDKAKSGHSKQIALAIMLPMLILINIVVLIQVRKLINYSLNG